MIISGVMPFETSKQNKTQQHGQAVKHQPIHRRGLSPAGSGGQNEQPNDAPDARGKGEEMSDLIDRKATIAHLKKRLIETAINNIGVIARCDSIFEDTADNRIGPWINELPSAQPEIIRCRDCKCWRELPNGCQGFCDMHSAYPTLTDFCSWAERREVNE